MKKMNMQHLEDVFNEAIEKKYNVAVSVTVPGCELAEVIVNPPANLKNKLEYYKKAYNDDLTLKSFSEIKIVGITSSRKIIL